MIIEATDHQSLAQEDRDYWRLRTAEERLDMVELLRLEAGKILYEYPAPFQRVITVIRK